jgi:hypothetical protein
MARASLGKDGRLVRHHGLAIPGSRRNGDTSREENTGYEFWALEYEVASGRILLLLNGEVSGTDFQDAVVVGVEGWRRIARIPVGGEGIH